MRLTTLTDYALRAALELAEASDQVSIDYIATRQDMSVDYLKTALNALKRGGIVESKKGRQGGFKLARKPNEITLADIIRAVDGPLTSVRGQRPEGMEYVGSAEGLELIWIALRAKERRVLESVTLSNVLERKFPKFITAVLEDPKSWELPS
jgi:Rrf2 family protein